MKRPHPDAGLPARSLEDALRIVTDAARERPLRPEGALLAAAFGPLHPFPDGPRGERLRARARAIFDEPRPGLLRLVLRRLAAGLEVLDLVGERLGPVPTRGDDAEGVLIRHRFGAREVTAHVSPSGASGIAVTLDVWGDSDARDVRVSLFRGARELASEVARHGRVLLPELGVGRYRVVLSDAAGLVGELDLAFEEAAAWTIFGRGADR